MKILSDGWLTQSAAYLIAPKQFRCPETQLYAFITRSNQAVMEKPQDSRHRHYLSKTFSIPILQPLCTVIIEIVL